MAAFQSWFKLGTSLIEPADKNAVLQVLWDPEPAKSQKFLNHRNCEIISVHGFKLSNLGPICYTAGANWYTSILVCLSAFEHFMLAFSSVSFTKIAISLAQCPILPIHQCPSQCLCLCSLWPPLIISGGDDFFFHKTQNLFSQSSQNSFECSAWALGATGRNRVQAGINAR